MPAQLINAQFYNVEKYTGEMITPDELEERKGTKRQLDDGVERQLEELQKEFKRTKLYEYCEDIDNAIQYYNGEYDSEKNADDFMEWYTETYIYTAEILYYHNAMDFLKEHDPSLMISLEKAEELGYSLDNLNSEILANLLLQDVLMETLEGLRSSIEEYFRV